MIDRTAILELAREKEIVANLLPRLSKHRIRELKKIVDTHLETRFYKRYKIPKYGSLNKGFTEDQLQAFMHVIDKPKYKLLFSYMAYLGLRVGEVVKVNNEDIDFQTREIRIKSEKTNKLDLLIIPLQLFQQTEAFINEHYSEIQESQGYIFFKEYNIHQRDECWLEPNYIRKIFGYYLHEARLDEVYDQSEEERSGRRPRKLHLLTSHSLRHYAISHFAKQTNGNLILTSKFARHLQPSTTTTYIHTEKEELFREIEKAFS